MSNLILIGPQNAGKSTTAQWIVHTSRVGRLSLDDRNQPWSRENQAAFKEARNIPASDPKNGTLFKLAEAQSVQQCVRSTDRAVIDFGAGHSVYSELEHFEIVRTALLGHHVVLLLPSVDIELSRLILHERCSYDIAQCDLANSCLDNPSNRRLARAVVYTKGKNPIEVAKEVLERVPDWTAEVATFLSNTLR